LAASREVMGTATDLSINTGREPRLVPVPRPVLPRRMPDTVRLAVEPPLKWHAFSTGPNAWY
jgi:hypothetical protein